MTTASVSVLNNVRSLAIATVCASVLFLGLPAMSHAQSAADLSVSASGMTATATFERSTPCTGYTIEWGDGEEDVVDDLDEICIQMVVTEIAQHTYEEEGEYEVTLTMNDESDTAEVVVPAEVIEFDLGDVATITAKWVDPNPQMADEEYYIYTITLEDDTVVTVQAAGFTTEEWRNEQFENAGYTGDVSELLDLVDFDETDDAPETPDVPATPAEPEKPTTLRDAYMQLRDLLQALITKLQQQITA